MAQPQLKLVGWGVEANVDAPGKKGAKPAALPVMGYVVNSADPVRRVFEHWVALNGLLISRCKLGPARRAAVAAALAMGYEEADLLLAVEGHAADPLEWARDAEMRRACRDIDWLMAREKRIEAAIDRGEQLRRLADEEAQAPAAVHAAEPDAGAQVDPAITAERRAQLRDIAARLRSQGA